MKLKTNTEKNTSALMAQALIGRSFQDGLQGRSREREGVKKISPEYSLEGLMLKLKLQYFGHLLRRTDSLEKILMLGKTEGRRRRE